MSPTKPTLTRIVGNRSSRSGVVPKLIVLHTTEGHNRPGVSDLEGLASWFDNPAAQASSHIGNDAEGNDVRMVPDEEKAWTQANYNSLSLSIEQVGFAATNRDDWFREASHQLANSARWIAYWSTKYGIPIRRAWTVAGGVQRSGVASHKQLGSAGGGHYDPGTGYPFKYVLLLARFFQLQTTRHRGDAGLEKARRRVNRIRKHYGLKLV